MRLYKTAPRCESHSFEQCSKGFGYMWVTFEVLSFRIFFFIEPWVKKNLSWKNRRKKLASWLGAHGRLKFSEITFLMLTLRSCCFCVKFYTLVWKDLLHCMILIYSLLFLILLKWLIIQSCNPTKVQYSTWKIKIVTL